MGVVFHLKKAIFPCSDLGPPSPHTHQASEFTDDGMRFRFPDVLGGFWSPIMYLCCVYDLPVQKKNATKQFLSTNATPLGCSPVHPLGCDEIEGAGIVCIVSTLVFR